MSDGKQSDDLREHMQRMFRILHLIPGSSEKRDEHWGKSGEFACPECGKGTVRWVRANINGHVHAGCSTPACFAVME